MFPDIGNSPLLAEYAPIGATLMGNKDGNNKMLF
jgi:hypothetical protein